MGHPGERVTLPGAHSVRHVFIAARERDRLERDGLDLVYVLRGELYNLSDAVVVDGVDDGGDERDLDADARQVLNRAQLDIEEIADAAMLVLLFGDAVEL